VLVAQFRCSYLKGEVELTCERERHITERHPDLLPEYYDLIVATLANPDVVRRSLRLGTARLISRWFDQVRGGKHLVVVVVSDPGTDRRHWIVTAYFSRRLAEGEREWQRS
jgi:hypothetical protein